MTRNLLSTPLVAVLLVAAVIAAAVALVLLGVEAGAALSPVVDQLTETGP